MHAPDNRRKRLSTVLRLLAAAVATFALAVLAAGCSAEDDIEAAASDIESDLLQDQLDAVTEAGIPGGVLWVKDPGTDPILISSGVANIETKAPISVDDAFRIGSVTKPYVAALVLQLVDEGALGLDDSVEGVLPGLLPNGDQITVRNLLGHRSGLFEYEQDPRVLKPYMAGEYGYEWTPEELIEIAVSHGSVAQPGTDVRYANTNYTVLGLIVEEVTGNSLGEELETRILAPLELDDTSFATGTKIEAPHANGYLAGQGPLQDVTGVSPTHYWAAGSLVSTAPDVAGFYEALLGGEVVSDESLDAMREVVREEPGLDRGLGFAHGKVSCGEWYGHDGAVPGYNITVRMMESGRQMVLMFNAVGLDDTLGNPEAQEAAVDLVDSALCR
jgi:D-alanyl-D-alanine carboxypeptidase